MCVCVFREPTSGGHRVRKSSEDKLSGIFHWLRSFFFLHIRVGLFSQTFRARGQHVNTRGVVQPTVVYAGGVGGGFRGQDKERRSALLCDVLGLFAVWQQVCVCDGVCDLSLRRTRLIITLQKGSATVLVPLLSSGSSFVIVHTTASR